MKGYLYILSAITAWGFEYVLVKAAGPETSPFLAGTVIFGIAGILLMGSLLCRGKLDMERMQRNLKSMLLIGLVSAACNVCWITGTQLTTVTNAAVLGRTDIMFTLLLTALIFHERIRKAALLFVPVMLTGVWLVLDLKPDRLSFGYTGDWLVIVSALLLSVNAFIIKRNLQDAGGTLLALGNCTVNIAVFAAVQLLYAPNGFLTEKTWNTLPALAGCGVCSFLFFIGYYQSLKVLPVWEVRLLSLAVPVVAAASGYFILGETASPGNAGGMLLVMAGAAGILLTGRYSMKDFIQKINFMKAKKVNYVDI